MLGNVKIQTHYTVQMKCIMKNTSIPLWRYLKSASSFTLSSEWMNEWKGQREKLHIVLKTTIVFLGQSVFHSALHTEQYSSTKSESQNCHFHIQSAILPSDRNNQEMRWAFSNGSTDTMLKHLYLESRKGYVKHHLIHVGTMFSAHILHNG